MRLSSLCMSLRRRRSQVQGAQGLVQQQHLGPVHQGPGDGHPLLLAAGEGGDGALFKALQVDHLEHLGDPLLDLLFRDLYFLLGLRVHLGDPQAEGDVLEHIEVGEQGVALEHGVDGPLVGRDRIDPHAVKKNIPGGGLLKTADNSKRGRLAAPTGTQQREELLVIDIQVDVVQHDLAVKSHGTVGQADQFLRHISSPFSSKNV